MSTIIITNEAPLNKTFTCPLKTTTEAKTGYKSQINQISFILPEN